MSISPWSGVEAAHPGAERVLDLPSPSLGHLVKSCAFSPSGDHLLTTTEGANLLVVDSVDAQVVKDLRYYDTTSPPLPVDAPAAHLTIHAGESINSTAWRPYGASTGVEYFAAAIRDHPIHVYNAMSGEIECSFVGRNESDELETPMVVCWDLNGSHLYSGAKSVIRVFDMECPGAPSCQFSTKAAARRGGLVSAIAFCPDYSGAYAVGTFSNHITVYVENAGSSPALELDSLPFGVTCLRWSPDGVKLWAGGRNDDDIICFDLRNTRSEIGRISRLCRSQQRYSFALDPWGARLWTGSQSGELVCFDTDTFQPMWRCDQAEADATHSVAIHPFSSLLAVASGQRLFVDEDSPMAPAQPPVSQVSLWKMAYNRLQLPG